MACQGVAHVLQLRVSSFGGLFLQAMQMPAPSHGSSILFKSNGVVTVWYFFSLDFNTVDFRKEVVGWVFIGKKVGSNWGERGGGLLLLDFGFSWICCVDSWGLCFEFWTFLFCFYFSRSSGYPSIYS